MRWILAVLLAGCAADAATPDAATSDAATSDAAAEMRTLDTCTTSIAADAPAFFQHYFKCVTITTTPTAVILESEDLPPHQSYYYGAGHPNYTEFDRRRPGYVPNPNFIEPQRLRVTVPLDPVPSGVVITPELVDGFAGTSDAEYGIGTNGIALDSVALFKGTAAAGDDIAQERFTFDSYEAHPQGAGVYHYHAPTPGPLEVLAAVGEPALEIYGILCDGTVVLGCDELDGAAPTGLDAQGGHAHDLTHADGTTLFADRYHTHVCNDAARGHTYTPEIHYYAECAP